MSWARVEHALDGLARLAEWTVEDDLAQRCRMTLRDYHRWCWDEDGTYHVSRLRIKWAIDNLWLEDQQRAAREHADAPLTFGRHGGTIKWLGGGQTDPSESAIFADEWD